MKAKELLDWPIEEISKYFKDQARARNRGVGNESLGLDIHVIFDFRCRPFRFDNIIKKGEMVVITPNGRYVIYIRNDKDTYKRVKVMFGMSNEVEIEIATCKYITGVIIDRKRFTA